MQHSLGSQLLPSYTDTKHWWKILSVPECHFIKMLMSIFNERLWKRKYLLMWQWVGNGRFPKLFNKIQKKSRKRMQTGNFDLNFYYLATILEVLNIFNGLKYEFSLFKVTRKVNFWRYNISQFKYQVSFFSTRESGPFFPEKMKMHITRAILVSLKLCSDTAN